MSPREESTMERHLFQPGSNEELIEELIGDSQSRGPADLATTDPHARARKGKVVWLLSKESRAPEKIGTSHPAIKGLLEADTDKAVVKQERDNGFVQADVLHCSGVLRPAANSGVDIVLLIKVRTHGIGPGTAELTAVSRAVVDEEADEEAYVPTSLSDKASAGEEPSLDLAKALAVSGPATLDVPAPATLDVPASATLDALSGRQREVLSLIVRGMSNKEIARALSLAEGTVKIHVAALFRKLGIRGRAAVAVEGARLLAKQ
jgi:DNA-binding NarL/FixJ family response regulator